MVAFEILMNGKPLYTIAAGDFGHLQATAMWMRLMVDDVVQHEIAGFVGVSTRGLDDTPACWPKQDLKVGDEITIRMIEVDSYEPPEYHQPMPSFNPTSTTTNIYRRPPFDVP